MRIKVHDSGYQLWLSARDTYDWAHKAGNSWPCSTVSDYRLFVDVDINGLCVLTVDGGGADIDSDELEAIVADHLPTKAKQHWPTWSRL